MVQSWSPTTDLPSNKQLMSKDFCWLNQGDLKTQLPRVHLCSPLWPERTSWHEPELTASLRAKKTRTVAFIPDSLFLQKFTSDMKTWVQQRGCSAPQQQEVVSAAAASPVWSHFRSLLYISFCGHVGPVSMDTDQEKKVGWRRKMERPPQEYMVSWSHCETDRRKSKNVNLRWTGSCFSGEIFTITKSCSVCSWQS